MTRLRRLTPLVGGLILPAIPACNMPPDAPLAVPVVSPTTAPGGPNGVKYSRTTLGMSLSDRDDLIVLEMDGKRYIFLQSTDPTFNARTQSRAMVLVSETPIESEKVKP